MSLPNVRSRLIGALSLTALALAAPKRFLSGWAVLLLFLAAVGQGRADWMYWTDVGAGDIRRANLDGSGQTTLVSGLGMPSGVSLDLADGKMYWADPVTADISLANLDGSGRARLLTGLSSPAGTTLDLAGRQIYWSNGFFGGPGAIMRANLDGTGKTTLISGLNGPGHIALDLQGGQMYWTEGTFVGSSGVIRRANLDGSGQETLIAGLSQPARVALDVTGGKMYWCDYGDGKIGRANLDGSNQEILINGPASAVGLALDLAAGKMYWSTPGAGRIERANLDGTGQETLLAGLNAPTTIALQLGLQTGFEPGEGYAGTDMGTVLTAQKGWYLPPNNVFNSSDFFVYTYDGKTLGLPPNPAGATQFVGGQSLGDGNFPSAQMDFDWSSHSRWTVEYDLAAHFNGTLPAPDDLGSFSVQPGGIIVGENFSAVNRWADTAGAATWNALYVVYDANGLLTTSLSPGDSWTNLAVDNWYRQSTTFDLSKNTITSVSITDLKTGMTTTATPNGWYLRSDAQPTALRFLISGADGSFPGNVIGFDNLSITPAGGGN